MRVIALTSRCIASGSCVLSCPQVFDQRDSDGTVHVLQEHPSLDLLQKVQKAVNMCPAQVFITEDEENTSELTIVENDQDM